MPNERRWIAPDEALAFNRLAVEHTCQPFFLRDRGLLEGALDRPRNRWHYDQERDRGVLGAHLLVGFAHNHPFKHGNKRTALLVADAFLAINGYDLGHDDDALAELILGMVDRIIAEPHFIRRCAAGVARIAER